MTNKEINEMEAGRIMDALIAERVMGHKLFRAKPKKTAICGGSRVSLGVYIDTGETHEWGNVVEEIPHYSSDISKAWLVVLKVFGIGYPIRLFGDIGDYAVTFRFTARGDTLPLAICRAALLVVN